ncbi:hypothetical protein DCCM_3634 [Desulfocucumis palustris]|uniref:Uncharacterized protein n=1 Tax=Desulfocucumis palustris TaxID=1898651 RepID=A0A2L2XJR7_9FIRM|nr:hypothetical protein DCCM_3634 [Desulfocucumis palustris]
MSYFPAVKSITAPRQLLAPGTKDRIQLNGCRESWFNIREPWVQKELFPLASLY